MARNDNDSSKKKMSREEAGKKGGEATRDSHDKSFYEEIGSETGNQNDGNFKNDPERAREAGKKGGKS